MSEPPILHPLRYVIFSGDAGTMPISKLLLSNWPHSSVSLEKNRRPQGFRENWGSLVSVRPSGKNKTFVCTNLAKCVKLPLFPCEMDRKNEKWIHFVCAMLLLLTSLAWCCSSDNFIYQLLCNRAILLLPIILPVFGKPTWNAKALAINGWEWQRGEHTAACAGTEERP